MPVCLLGGGEAEQIEGAALGRGGGGEDGGEVIAPKADDIAGERGESVARSPSRVWKLRTGRGSRSAGSVRLRAALRRAAGEGSALATGEVRCASRTAGSGSSNSIGARLWRMCHCR